MIRFVRRIELTRNTPIYNIGAVSRLCGLPIWTLRWIEKHDLVSPKRTDGNQRLYSEADVTLLKLVRSLMEEKVNLAGIRVILRMREAESRVTAGTSSARRRGPSRRRGP